MHPTVALVAAILPVVCTASEELIPELEQRIANGNADTVNAYLVANATTALVPFGQRAAACELKAVSLAVQLSRSANTRAAQAHTQAIRVALGNCPAFVLALATPQEIPKFCASVPFWTVGQTVRELRRRMAVIEANEVMANSQNGKSCRAAYLHELRTTRVVLRSASPEPRGAQQE